MKLAKMTYETIPSRLTFEIPEGEESERGAENLLEEIMAENFPHLGKKTHPDPVNIDSSKKIHQKTHTMTHYI